MKQKKLFLWIALVVTAGIFLVAESAMAMPGAFNVRPVLDPPADLFMPHNGIDAMTLGGGPGSIFDTINAVSYDADPVNTQSPFAIFENDAASGTIATFIISLTAHAPFNQSGIYKYCTGGPVPALLAPIFTGAGVIPNQTEMATIGFHSDGTLTVTPVLVKDALNPGWILSPSVQQQIIPNFGSTFGFYLDGPGGQFYSQDVLNPGGDPQALIYQGNDSDIIQIPGFSAGCFTDDEFIIAFEDEVYAQSDKDFNDNVFLVESIMPVPEPGSLLLMGMGLLGLLGLGVRRKRS